MKINPRVNILILNWNGKDILKDCINSIQKNKYSNFHITIIDNGSKDSVIDQLEFSNNLSIIKLEENIGYSRGYNYAFKKIKNIDDDYYLILNNDTILDSNAILSASVFSRSISGESAQVKGQFDNFNVVIFK